MAVILLSYQNCSKTFEVASSMAKSSSCVKAIQNSSVALASLGPDLNCMSSSLYSCEQRIFSPSVKTLIEAKEKCITFRNQSFCVQVTSRFFDTSMARKSSGASESDFAPGGDYNREESNCFHDERFRDVPLFVGTGSDLGSALQMAVESCERKMAGIVK